MHIVFQASLVSLGFYQSYTRACFIFTKPYENPCNVPCANASAISFILYILVLDGPMTRSIALSLDYLGLDIGFCRGTFRVILFQKISVNFVLECKDTLTACSKECKVYLGYGHK